MSITAQVTPYTDTLDAFARANHPSHTDTDTARADIIFWNIDWFTANPTFHLPHGVFLYTSPPPTPVGNTIQFGDPVGVLVMDGRTVHVVK